MTQNDLIVICFFAVLLLIFGFFIGLIIFFASKNNTLIALKVDGMIITICYALFSISFFYLVFHPYDYGISRGLPGDPQNAYIILTYKAYLPIIIVFFLLPFSIFSNKSLSNIKSQKRPKHKLMLLFVFILMSALIIRKLNIISKMTYEEQEIHFKEIGYSPGC